MEAAGTEGRKSASVTEGGPPSHLHDRRKGFGATDFVDDAAHGWPRRSSPLASEVWWRRRESNRTKEVIDLSYLYRAVRL